MKRMLLKAAAFLAVSTISLPASAIFTNGGFETGDFTGWNTDFGFNSSLSGSPPFISADINIGAGGSFRGVVLTSGPELTNAPITLPHVGTHTARVNNDETGGYLNIISQTDTITNADRDAGDNKLHVRFDYAVVLEDGGHEPYQQPFFYLRVRNVTTDTILFDTFAFALQAGSGFVAVPSPTNGRPYQYLDWQHADVVVPNANIGDQIEVYLLASDCGQGGHSGYAYLDGFGSKVVTPTGPTSPTTAPALGEAALVALGLLLLGGATFATRRS